MLTDIKMPHMDGLELSKKAREEYPDLEIIIFSGYGDFAFAQEAIRYGVTDYVLKPVDPDRFHDTIQKIQKEIASRKNKEQQSIKEKSFLQQYFLQSYLYSETVGLSEAHDIRRKCFSALQMNIKSKRYRNKRRSRCCKKPY